MLSTKTILIVLALLVVATIVVLIPGFIAIKKCGSFAAGYTGCLDPKKSAAMSLFGGSGVGGSSCSGDGDCATGFGCCPVTYPDGSSGGTRCVANYKQQNLPSGCNVGDTTGRCGYINCINQNCVTLGSCSEEGKQCSSYCSSLAGPGN